MINGHGDEIHTYKGTLRANFSSNTWYGGPSPGLIAYLQEKVHRIDHYPDPGAERLQRTIALQHGWEEDEVLVTNGATEAIYLVAQAFRGQTATILAPSFAEYEDACHLHGIRTVWMDWKTLEADTRFQTDLVFICNPNNPTGQAVPLATLQEVLLNNPQSCFIIDEAYIGFTNATQRFVTSPEAPGNYILLHSLTKTCCIPGLRLGFIVATADRVRAVRACKMPWSVNSLALEAGEYIYRHPKEFDLPLERLLSETALLQQELHAVTGWKVLPSATHYFLFETGKEIKAAALKERLLQEHGILIRDASNFRGLSAHSCRIACQQPGHNQLLLQALIQCCAT